MVPPKPERERRRECQRSVPWAASADNIPGTVTKPRTGVNGTRQSGDSGVRAHPLPRFVVGPKAQHFARGESLVDSAGSQRVRVIVVESLGSRHRTNVSVGICPAERRKAKRRGKYLA
jgi:hypothetical protein